MAEFDNATLIEIASPGPLADNGDPGTPVAVWTGRAGGYLKRARKNVRSSESQVRVEVITFTLLRTVAPEVADLIVAGSDDEASTVVIEDNRTPTTSTLRYRVNAAENRAAGTIVDSLKLELENGTAP